MKSEDLFVGFIVVAIVCVLGYLLISSRVNGYQTPAGFQRAVNWAPNASGALVKVGGSYYGPNDEPANLSNDYAPKECQPGWVWNEQRGMCLTKDGRIPESLYGSGCPNC